jgi:hypothetical protein
MRLRFNNFLNKSQEQYNIAKLYTRTNHATHQSRWRIALPQYHLKSSRPYYSHVPLPNAGVLFAVRRASFMSAIVLTPPPDLIPHIAGLKIVPHSGTPYLLIGAYMPQLHTPHMARLYAKVAAWGLRLADDHPQHRALWGGDVQSTTTTGAGHPAFTSLLKSHLQPLHDPIPTFPRSGGCLDRWLTTLARSL